MELQVMILDDEPIILDGLCSFPWKDYGCKVAAVAKNGIEGMRKLEETVPDLILLKCREWTGWNFPERQRRNIRILQL